MTSSRTSIELPAPVDVLGLPVRPLQTHGLIEALVMRAKAGVPTTACYANAHTVNRACRDEEFASLLRGCELLYADGASVVWASRWSSRRLPERMTAADYFEEFAGRCAAEGTSLFLLGGMPGVAEEAARRLRMAFPRLHIVGTHHGHFDEGESGGVIAAINQAGPDIIAVGLSSPRQERWLATHSAELKAPVRWCVGALFDYVAGRERRAPAWLCRMGGEWLFRLIVDPIGKWRRYLLGNPRFVLNTLRWRWGRRRETVPTAEVLPVPRG